VIEILHNPAHDRALPPRPPASRPRRLHERLPGYAPTPLREAPGLADELGVGRVLLKDEGERLGLPAFKALGASWAIACAIAERLGDPAPPDDPAELRERAAVLAPLSVVCATDGNHGRAVAHVANVLGLTAEVVVPAGTAPARIAAIEGEGARVEVVDGDYDAAQRRSDELAAAGGLLVADIAWPGNEVIPARVIDGYATIFEELDGQLDELPDLVLVPIGVGALATAAVAHWGGGGPLLVGVEPADAACALASVRAGDPVTVPGPHGSAMAGLNCGTLSLPAWPALRAGFAAFCAIDDAAALWGVRRLAALGLDRGECSGGVVGAARELLAHDRLGLGPDATVLLPLTEGVTDPELFERTVGRVPRR
jgi:diaminopropionate ammonia-lyase